MSHGYRISWSKSYSNLCTKTVFATRKLVLKVNEFSALQATVLVGFDRLGWGPVLLLQVQVYQLSALVTLDIIIIRGEKCDFWCEKERLKCTNDSYCYSFWRLLLVAIMLLHLSGWLHFVALLSSGLTVLESLSNLVSSFEKMMNVVLGSVKLQWNISCQGFMWSTC